MSTSQNYLWHYTTLKGLEGILRSQLLWATHFKYLNDRSEFLCSQEILENIFLPDIRSLIEKDSQSNDWVKVAIQPYEGIDKFAIFLLRNIMGIFSSPLLEKQPVIKGEPFYSIPCVLSFSQPDCNDEQSQQNGLLSQWRGYGKDGGYALVFDKEELCAMFEEEKLNYDYGFAEHGKTYYSKNEYVLQYAKYINRFRERIEDRSRYILTNCQQKETPLSLEDIQSIIYCMVFLKHEGFKEEREYRFVVYPKALIHQDNWGSQEKKKELKKILFRRGDLGFIPYVNLFETREKKRLPIKKICVGPHKEAKQRVLSIKAFLREMHLDGIKVEQSNIPYC